MDSYTGQVLDKYQDNLQKSAAAGDSENDLDDEDFMDLLEDAPDGYREKRMQELATHMANAKRNLEMGDYGKVTRVTEKQIFDITTGEDDRAKCVVLHFTHPDFKRCKIMSKRLEAMAKKHLQTRFIEVEAPDAPFLVTKLGVQVLPCVVGFINGKEAMRLVGFEQLGNADDFTNQALQFQLFKSGLVSRSDNSGFGTSGSSAPILGYSKKSVRDGENSSDDEY